MFYVVCFMLKKNLDVCHFVYNPMVPFAFEETGKVVIISCVQFGTVNMCGFNC